MAIITELKNFLDGDQLDAKTVNDIIETLVEHNKKTNKATNTTLGIVSGGYEPQTAPSGSAGQTDFPIKIDSNGKLYVEKPFRTLRYEDEDGNQSNLSSDAINFISGEGIYLTELNGSLVINSKTYVNNIYFQLEDDISEEFNYLIFNIDSHKPIKQDSDLLDIIKDSNYDFLMTGTVSYTDSEGLYKEGNVWEGYFLKDKSTGRYKLYCYCTAYGTSEAPNKWVVGFDVFGNSWSRDYYYKEIR